MLPHGRGITCPCDGPRPCLPLSTVGRGSTARHDVTQVSRGAWLHPDHCHQKWGQRSNLETTLGWLPGDLEQDRKTACTVTAKCRMRTARRNTDLCDKVFLCVILSLWYSMTYALERSHILSIMRSLPTNTISINRTLKSFIGEVITKCVKHESEWGVLKATEKILLFCVFLYCTDCPRHSLQSNARIRSLCSFSILWLL